MKSRLSAIYCGMFAVFLVAASEPPPVLWEYATLNIVDRFNAIIWTDSASKSTDYEAFQALGGKVSKADFDGAGLVGRENLIMNAAGQHGWELVCLQQERPDVVDRVFWLKRPKKYGQP